jgi:hypothetical protein
MHTVELLDEALALAERSGIRVRQDWFGGGSGACELHGQRWIFIDLAASPREQLEAVLAALGEVGSYPAARPSGQLEAMLRMRKAA